MPGLPLVCINENDEPTPKDWNISQNESLCLESIKVCMEEALKLEEETKSQIPNSKWMELCKRRMTSTNSHSVFIRKCNLKTLALYIPKGRSQLQPNVQENLEHSSMTEPIDREKIACIMQQISQEDYCA